MPESKSKKLAVVVLAALVAVLVITGIALMMRGGDNAPVRIILPTLERSLAGEAVAGTELSPKTKAEPEIQVYVSGAVRRPGVYTLIPGERLIDAVEAAGVDPCDAAPDHWRHIHNRIAAGHQPRLYTVERHSAWLKRREIEG